MLKQFTDGSFRREIKPAPWMGYVGPLIKGETGDVVYVHFRNMASRPYNLHPHGVQYFKNGEGTFCLCSLVSFYVYVTGNFLHLLASKFLHLDERSN